MFIGDFEEYFLVKKWIGVQPKLWQCYIDDIRIVISHYYFTIQTIQYFHIYCFPNMKMGVLYYFIVNCNDINMVDKKNLINGGTKI